MLPVVLDASTVPRRLDREEAFSMKFAIMMLAIVSCWFSVESVVAGGPLKKTADYYEALQEQYIDKQVEIYFVEIKKITWRHDRGRFVV